jgi:hypothetical protein
MRNPKEQPAAFTGGRLIFFIWAVPEILNSLSSSVIPKMFNPKTPLFQKIDLHRDYGQRCLK